MSEISVLLNTHSSSSDCWRMFFGCLQRYWPSHPKVVVACDSPVSIENTVLRKDYSRDITFVDYSPTKKFSNQYLIGLCAVETPYVLTLQEDFLLYGDVNEAAIRDAIENIGNYSSLRLIDSGPELEYSMQASVWGTQALKLLYASIDCGTPWEAELTADAAMQYFGMRCKRRDDSHLPMRGRNHRDSPIFPYISTALVRGKWNTSEYPELPPLLKEYGIDPSVRGEV